MNDATAPRHAEPVAIAAASVAPAQIDLDADLEYGGTVGDLPAWQRDVVNISARVRVLLTTLRPLVVQVLGFWDHVVRRVALAGGRSVEIDPSGCYRLR
jgi:hypothetical protein